MIKICIFIFVAMKRKKIFEEKFIQKQKIALKLTVCKNKDVKAKKNKLKLLVYKIVPVHMKTCNIFRFKS